MQHRKTFESMGIETFYEQLVEPFYDCIDEQIDDTGATLALLIRHTRCYE